MNIHIQRTTVEDDTDVGVEMEFTLREFRIIMGVVSQKKVDWPLYQKCMELMRNIPGVWHETLLDDAIDKSGDAGPASIRRALCHLQSQFSQTLGVEVIPEFQRLLAGNKKKHSRLIMSKEAAYGQRDCRNPIFCNRIWITE